MIKTLQISSILAVVLAAVLFVSSVVFGVHKDAEVEAFLKSPSIKEKFTETMGGAVKRPSDQSSPLVENAQRFASIIDPPKPTAPERPPVSTTPVVTKAVEPAQTSAKFRVLGTSYYQANPLMSLAFIDEPGKGLHWVRQGSEIMHLTIEEVKDGRIVVRDAQGASEMVAEDRPITVSLLEGSPAAAGKSAGATPAVAPGSSPAGGQGSRPPIPPAAGSAYPVRNPRAAGGAGDEGISNGAYPSIPPRASIPPRTTDGRRPPVSVGSLKSRLSEEENARLASLGDRLKAMQEAQSTRIVPNEAENEDEAMAMMKKLLADAEQESPEAEVQAPAEAQDQNEPASNKVQAPPSTARRR